MSSKTNAVLVLDYKTIVAAVMARVDVGLHFDATRRACFVSYLTSTFRCSTCRRRIYAEVFCINLGFS